ncbi:MAG: type VI secretion system contractile sheath large subunit [Rubrivivax sp.]|nr:type VI secretion system contractile sheath large subunit [Rubrivivax sp.]
MQFNLDLGRAASTRAAGGAAQGPLRLLVLGDFSARPACERPPLGERRTHRVDLDSIDTVMQRLAPRLQLAAGEIDFGQLDDFHPDALYRRLELFAALREARAKPPQAGGDLLGALLGQPTAAPAASAAPAAAPAEMEAFIRSIVAPHIVQDNSAQGRPYVAAVDAAITEQMRKLLHDPTFQALESAWRGVQWLIQSLELDETLELHLFDVGRDELLADVVAAQGQLAQTGLHRALVDRWRNMPGAHGWSLLTGLYRFGPGDTDIGLLAALGLLASQAGGPFVAGGDPALAGDDVAALAGWQALRHSEAAPWIGLAAPRVLLRLPYGKATDKVESFDFEEFDATPVHDEFLWGHGSLAVALLIGRAFSARGWAFEPGDEREIGDLPAYTYLQDGERELQACAEQYLGEQGGNALLAAGLMPVLSHRHANAVTVMRFQSLAEPAAPLAGLASAAS